MAANSHPNVLVTNINDLVTLAPLAEQRRYTNIGPQDLGRMQSAWLAVEGGKIAAFGTGDQIPEKFSHFQAVDAGGGLVMPGLVDAHTHPIYAGSRAHEFCQRLDGETYQSIAAAGGGIKHTVRNTRTAATDDLLEDTLRRLFRFLHLGVTTVEVKSGYGLSVKDELRLLEVLKTARQHTPQTLSITCLALHALPPEFTRTEDYVEAISRDLVPKIAEGHLADAVDAFVEKGYFEVSQTEPYITAAKSAGLAVRVHADEFQDGGAAAAAARWGALSADHLEHASDDGIAAMARAGVVAVILPGTSLYCALPFANARRLIEAKVPVALATDFNPGSCQVDNLPMMATIGALHCGLKPAEVVAAVTWVAARALRLQKGALAVGFDADFAIHSLTSVEEWLADLGRHPPEQVWIAGKRVH